MSYLHLRSFLYKKATTFQIIVLCSSPLLIKRIVDFIINNLTKVQILLAYRRQDLGFFPPCFGFGFYFQTSPCFEFGAG